MKKNVRILISVFFILIFLFSTAASAQDADELKQRREKVRSSMTARSVMILKGEDGSHGPGKFRQKNNLFYLTGLNEPGVSLILLSDDFKSGLRSMRMRSLPNTLLFVTPVNEAMRDWDPGKIGVEGAMEKYDIRGVYPNREFQDYFEMILSSRPETVYMDIETSRGLREPLTYDEQILDKARAKGLEFELIPSASLIHTFRRIKSDSEIELLRKAINITAEAHNESFRAAEPGMFEYQLQSIIEHVFTMNGAARPGFNSIVGSGRNGCILHWDENSRKMQDGDLVVIDIGAEYGMYTADITRTLPVNGKFTKRQKDVYEIVLRANEEVIKMIRPGLSWNDAGSKAREVLAEGLINIGLIENASELRRYYYHGLGHPIGLQVHEVGGTGVLEPGMVMTVEPGLYIREENFGIRIEDDVLVTEDGNEVLSKNTPKSVEEVEKMMRGKGIDFKRYIIR